MTKNKNRLVLASTAATASRRQVVAGLGAVGATGLIHQPGAAQAAREPPSGAKQWFVASGSKGNKVPLDYLGLHSDHGVSQKAPAPAYPYDAIRSHDVDNGHDLPATQWADIEKTPGVYDWRLTDKWVETHPNKTRVWVLFGTPSFYQKYPNERFVFPHLPGGGSPPKDPRVAATFIKTLLDRYPGAIQFVEIWNEPNFGPGTDPEKDRWTPDINEPGWFTGSASDLAELARVVKSVLPSGVKLMAAGWAWQAKDDQLTPANSVLRFAQAPDRAGGIGRDHVDALSVHLYTYDFNPNPTIGELQSYEKLFDQCSYPKSLPRYVTETGAWYPGVFTADNPSPSDKARIVKRWCMIPALFGYRGVYLYKHSDLETLGDPAKVPPISAAIAEMRERLRGKTIRAAALLDDDTLWMSFSDGTELHV
jgi:hypothetical protein